MEDQEPNFENALIGSEKSILDAIKIIDHAALQIALVVDENRRLIGTVTDGDIRRGILGGIKLEDPVSKVMNSSPQVITAQTTREESLRIMTDKKIHQLPVVDSAGKIINLAQMDNLMNKSSSDRIEQENIWVVLMLGGQGVRLLPLTQDTPKPMLSVGDKPLLETIIGNLASQGFKKFFFSVNYKADIIRRHFGDGSHFGVEITYLTETIPLGTAGALSLLPERPKTPIVVMNGDILTNSNFKQLIDFHRQNKAVATMCVREYQQQVPYGVIESSGTKLTSIMEKPMQSYFVNAGIYVINPEVFDFVPEGRYFDMPQLFDELKKADKESAVFPIREYWLDIGRFEDLERARTEYKKVFG